MLKLLVYICKCMGWGSSVGIATLYGLDSLGIKSWWRRDFLQPSRLALQSTQLPIQWILGLDWGEIGQGVALTTHPHLALRLWEE